ncbi:nucleotide exchange factor GrpE [Serinicoccus sediminis]|uniref:nucleotide exchange factor GrpE n=1 Tax=Serinicoccus sediminis TaxID=2306021 RepID=UPI0010227ED4|nr:nucleotide exchange factor GrpE [Serinicoccus sediminis]
MDDDVRLELTSLRESVSNLSDLFVRRLMEDKARNSMYEALQEQVRESRDLLRQKDIESLTRELLLALDRLRDGELSEELVASFVEEVHEVFARRGLREIPDYPVFDSSVHEVLETVPTQVEEEAGSVLATHRRGYRFQGRLLRAAQVSVAVQADGGRLVQSTPPQDGIDGSDLGR